MAHIHEKVDFTAEVFVVHEGKVLLRKHDKYRKWLSVGGHIDLGEDPNEAAVREVKEEVGLDVELYRPPGFAPHVSPGYRELIPPAFLNRHDISATHEHVSHVFFARAPSDALVLSETEVAEECRWFTREEILAFEELDPVIRRYALAALDVIAPEPIKRTDTKQQQ